MKTKFYLNHPYFYTKNLNIFDTYICNPKNNKKKDFILMRNISTYH